VQTNKYLNNRIEQDHRAVKRRCESMAGFKYFANASITIAGIAADLSRDAPESVGVEQSIVNIVDLWLSKCSEMMTIGAIQKCRDC